MHPCQGPPIIVSPQEPWVLWQTHRPQQDTKVGVGCQVVGMPSGTCPTWPHSAGLHLHSRMSRVHRVRQLLQSFCRTEKTVSSSFHCAGLCSGGTIAVLHIADVELSVLSHHPCTSQSPMLCQSCPHSHQHCIPHCHWCTTEVSCEVASCFA